MSKRLLRHIVADYISDVSATLSCVTHQRVLSMPSYNSEHPHSFVIHVAKIRPIQLAGRSPIWLTFAQTIRSVSDDEVRSHRIEIAGYHYRIGFGEEGNQELLAYHFDPYNEESGSGEPHLHVGRSAYRPLNTGPFQHFHKRHIPTGRVRLCDVVRFLIEELDMEPINPNWDSVLVEAASR